MVGQILSHYRVLSPLGRGAMGEVFQAEDVRLGRRVAIKVLPAEVCCVPAAVDRFQREARIISSLNHPNICTLFDIGEHDGQQFMVMELLEGVTLATRMAAGPLLLDDVLAFGADAAAALDAAHRQNVVHRDIKPANLFVTAASVLKVLDFGVAKLSDAGGALDTTHAATSQLTMVGTAVGTVAYMSPEQARGEAIDGRSDIFSLGVVLYEMAAGRPPFSGATAAGIFEGILTKTPAPPSTHQPGLPAALDTIVLKALEKDPARRYQSAADLRADLQALRRASDPQLAVPLHAPAPSTARSKAWWLAAPLATAAVVAAVVGWQSAHTPALESKDLVVLSELTNRTGDTMFDDTLTEALAVQLRQSPFLNVVPDQRVQATLRMMQRPAGTPVDVATGRELCQRVGARALLTSSIASLGSSYVITLGALDCVTGDTLAEQQAQAARKEDVLRQLGEATHALREQLGESLPSLTRYDANVEAATTASLEALKAYSQALAARRSQGDRVALPLFRRAIEIDPDFALAHARLGTVYANLNDGEASRRHTQRAYELRSEVSELERLYIEARYYSVVQSDTPKAVETYRITLATYPNDYTAHVNLGVLLKGEGELDDAITLLQEAKRLSPEEPTARVNLAATLVDARRYAEARREAEEALSVRDDESVRTLLMAIAAITGDAELEAAQTRWATSRDDVRESLFVRWGVATYRGRLREAADLVAQGEQAFGAIGLWPVVGRLRAGMALTFALAEDRTRATALLKRLEHDHPVEDTADELVVVAALLRDPALARRWLPVTLKPRSTSLEDRRVATLLTALADAASDPVKALGALTDLRQNVNESEVILIRGVLALRLGRHDEALRDFEWFRDHGRIDLSTNAAACRYLLARALDGAGRQAEARAAYADFLEFWKTADRDLPIVIEASKAFARLSS